MEGRLAGSHCRHGMDACIGDGAGESEQAQGLIKKKDHKNGERMG